MRSDVTGPLTGAPAPRASWRAVAVPHEHGGWALIAEPALLGLIAVPSAAGAALAGAALLAFVARTPIGVVLVDRHRHRRLARTGLATRIAAVEVVVGLVLLAVALWLADGVFWPALVLASPLVAVQLWFDQRSRRRHLVPELAGATATGALAAAIVLAGGGAIAVAAAAWLCVAARVIAAIPFVRHQVARIRQRPQPTRRTSDVAQVVAVAVAGAGTVAGWLPLGAGTAVAVLAAVHLALARMRPPPSAVVAGVQQTVLGLAFTFIAGLAL